ncbi:MAG: hypothetical protein R2744_04820 [Bacteroidales bacterium]
MALEALVDYLLQPPETVPCILQCAADNMASKALFKGAGFITVDGQAQVDRNRERHHG